MYIILNCLDMNIPNVSINKFPVQQSRNKREGRYAGFREGKHRRVPLYYLTFLYSYRSVYSPANRKERKALKMFRRIYG